MILRREAILALGGYRAEYKNAEDYDLWLRASRTHSLANIPVPLLRYRFSAGGMTLGRKWQQAIFARMAVVSHLHPAWTHEQVGAEALLDLEKQGKEWFLEQVASGTIQELIALGLYGDAWRILRLFWTQMENGRGLRVARIFGRELLSASLARGKKTAD